MTSAHSLIVLAWEHISLQNGQHRRRQPIIFTVDVYPIGRGDQLFHYPIEYLFVFNQTCMLVFCEHPHQISGVCQGMCPTFGFNIAAWVFL